MEYKYARAEYRRSRRAIDLPFVGRVGVAVAVVLVRDNNNSQNSHNAFGWMHFTSPTKRFDGRGGVVYLLLGIIQKAQLTILSELIL